LGDGEKLVVMTAVVEQLYLRDSVHRNARWREGKKKKKANDARTYVTHKLDLDSIVRRALTVSNANRDLPFALSTTKPNERETE
jgi:hypothetical protein